MKLSKDECARFGACLVTLLALARMAAPPLAAEAECRAEAAAHVVLTDGQRGADDGEGWVRLYADSTRLPKLSYGPDDFALWGISGPNYGFSPTRDPIRYALIKDAGIRGVRYDVQWAQVQYYGPHLNLWNANSLEDDINQMLADGMSVQCVVGFFPAWSNGLRYRAVPPNQPVEAETLSFATSDTQRLAHTAVITALPDEMPVSVTPFPVPTEHAEDIVTGFVAGSAPRTSKWPIIPETARVWVAEPPLMEFREWTRVRNLINSPDQAEHFQIDRDGRAKFRNDAFFLHHGRTPAAGSSVKISYDYITRQYEPDVDYRLNNLQGVITRIPGDIDAPAPDETFEGPGLSDAWQWTNPPATWDAGGLLPGHLTYTNSTTDPFGHFLYQELTGSGDFSLILRTTAAPNGADQLTGIMVYQDENNWFRYGYGYLYRPHLCRCVNGVVTHLSDRSVLGDGHIPPGYLSVRKSGNLYTVFSSKTSTAGPSGYERAYTFEMPLPFPLRVGISSIREKASAVIGAVSIDRFTVARPAIPADEQVAVFYNYLDSEPYCSFIYDMVDHFKHRVRHWEIVNEPNTAFCWRGGMDIYAKLFADASAAVHAADPDSLVLNGGLANGKSENLATMYDIAGGASFDLAAWHPYTFSSKEPGVGGWDVGPESTNGNNRSIMLRYGDQEKMVFFGEIATPGGVISRGGPMNERLQADYAMRTFLLTRKLGWVKAVQWHPAVDMSLVGTDEANMNGGHEGLFYAESLIPKPVYYAYKNAASNKGFLVDLVSFDPQSNPVPSTRAYDLSSVVVGTADRAKISEVKVYTSFTATDAESRPPKVAARHVGQAGAAPIVVDVATDNADLRTEVWTAVAATPLTFVVSGSLSGAQGLALVGEQFVSANGAVSFTIPGVSKVYIPGDSFTFETFAGDGFELAGTWTRSGESGPGDIVVPLEPGSRGRYISVRFVEAPGADFMPVDEIAVFDTGGTNVAEGKLYLIDGHQSTFEGYEPTLVERIGALQAMPEGSQVQLAGKALHSVGDGFGYVCEVDRASGIRVEGNLEGAQPGRLVKLDGELVVNADGEKAVDVRSLQDLGACEVRALVMKNHCAQRSNSAGLPVRVFGRVVSRNLNTGMLVISDGSHASGVHVTGVTDPSITPGQFVTVTGASGYNGHCLIHASQVEVGGE